MTTADVARELGITTRQVRNLASEGKIPCTRTDGGHRRFAVSDVSALKKSRANPSAPEDGVVYPRIP